MHSYAIGCDTNTTRKIKRLGKSNPRPEDMKNKKETNAIRENSGVHECFFLQEIPNGHLVILTLEGNDPVAG